MEDFNAEIARGGPFDCAQGAWVESRIGEPVEPSVLVFLMTDPSTALLIRTLRLTRLEATLPFQGAWAKPRIGEPVEPSVLVLQTDGNFN